MENQALDFILNRKSIRKFKPKPISKEIINTIVKAGQRAPTACGMQLYSFVLVTDPKIKNDIFEEIGKHKYTEGAPVWIVVCADLARQSELFKILGVRANFGKLNKLIPSLFDAVLAAENMVIAAETLGLGSVFVGTIWKCMKRVATILNLPGEVLPLALLCLGYPDEAPPLKPRWPLEAVLHENAYKLSSKEVMEKYYKEGNRELVDMKYFRKGIKDWAEHWQTKFKIEETTKQEKIFRKDLHELGFLP